MSKSDDLEFLGHIFGEVQFILETTNNLTEADFFENGTIKRAVVRSFEIIE